MISTNSWDVVVIGGGLGGLISAAYLTRAGAKTLVLEKQQRCGGRTASEPFGDYWVDRDPHFSHKILLEVLDELAVQVPFRDVPAVRLYLQNQKHLYDPYPDVHDLELMSRILGEPRSVAKGIAETLDALRETPRTRIPELKKVELANWLGARAWSELGNGLALDLQYRALVNKLECVPQLSVGELVSFFTSGGPTESLIPRQKLYPADDEVGGLQALPEAFARYIVKNGGTIVTGARVVEIEARDGRATGVTFRRDDVIIDRVQGKQIVSDLPVWDFVRGVTHKGFGISPGIRQAASSLYTWKSDGTGVAVALRALPRRRSDGQRDDYAGWTRVLVGRSSPVRYAGGYFLPSLSSPKSAPQGMHLLVAMRASPVGTGGSLPFLRRIEREILGVLHEIYSDLDDVLLWVHPFGYTEKASGTHRMMTQERPEIRFPGVQGLYLVGDTVRAEEGRPFCLDLAAHSARVASRMMLEDAG